MELWIAGSALLPSLSKRDVFELERSGYRSGSFLDALHLSRGIRNSSDKLEHLADIVDDFVNPVSAKENFVGVRVGMLPACFSS